MKKKINIVFFSANRAEYGLIFPFLKIFSLNKNFKVRLIISGSHLEKKFGLSLNEIRKDKIKFYTKIKIPLKTSKLENTANYFNKLQNRINFFLEKNNPDLVFISSDRFETFAFAISSYLKKIPIIHYEGGDITEGGALDDNIRHAITKISNLHFTSNEDSLKRILKMGEETWRSCNVGYSPLYFLNKKKFNLNETKKKFSLIHNIPLILFTLHPIIKNKKIKKKEVDEIFNALKKLAIKNYQIIITYPNFDPGYDYIIEKIIILKKIFKNIKVIKHLGRQNYHSLLYYIGKKRQGFCMGNSSSGIKEAVLFNCPAVNIGDRQKSRLKPTNVVDVQANQKKIINLIYKKKFLYKKVNNPYKAKKIFKNLPSIVLKKIYKKDFKLKKSTI